MFSTNVLNKWKSGLRKVIDFQAMKCETNSNKARQIVRLQK